MTTDTSEKGFESLIVAAMTGHAASAPVQDGVVREPSAPYGGAGWMAGDPKDYDREYAVCTQRRHRAIQAVQR